MKHTLLIITALMLIVGCSSDKETPSSQAREPIDSSALVWKGNKPYAPDSDKPFSGEVVRYYGNGQKELEGSYKNGKPIGKWIRWHDNGQKEEERTYKDGKQDGLHTYWHENGQKKLKGTYKDGKQDGLQTWWYENGQKESEITYKDGEVISGKCWDEVGNEIDCDDFLGR